MLRTLRFKRIEMKEEKKNSVSVPEGLFCFVLYVTENFSFQYFNKTSHHWAADHDKRSDVGDIVIIKKLDEPQSAHVHYNLDKIVFKVGQTIDPITGKRCRGPEFLKEKTSVNSAG